MAGESRRNAAEEAAELGRRAEQLAFEYVTSLGWEALGRNVRVGRCEIDIAAVDSDELVIAEVRCRSAGKPHRGRGGRVQSAEESVGPRKIEKLVRAGTCFADRIGWDGPWRIDVIAVEAGVKDQPSEWRIEHIRDATGGSDYQL